MASLRRFGIVLEDKDLMMIIAVRVGSMWINTCLKSCAGRGSRLLDFIGVFSPVLSR